MALSGKISAPRTEPSFAEAAVAELFRNALLDEQAGRIEQAARVLGLLLRGAPDEPDVLHFAGVIACRQRRWPEALDFMQRSLVRGINTPLYVLNITEAYRMAGRLDDALAAGRRAVALNPDDPVVLSNLAVVHANRGEDDDAEACQRAALSLDPGCVNAHFGLAELLLARGDMKRGWEEYEWRFRMPGAASNLPPQKKPQWDGRKLAPGRLLIVADQGFGDGIQFGRYLPWVFERCPDPLLCCSSSLRPIMSQLGARHVFANWKDVPDYDAFIPLSGLPRLAGTRLDTIPVPIPYLTADASRVAGWKTRIAAMTPPAGRRIGIVWSGRSEHVNDHARSMHLSDLASFFALDRVVLISLQKGDRAKQAGCYYGRAPLLNIGPALQDWSDTMAVIATLDAVVSVDTAVAHLAGAMGCTVFLLLPRAAEWRWLRGCQTSPWYPSMRIFRQSVAGSWSEPTTAAAAEIRRLGAAVPQAASVRADVRDRVAGSSACLRLDRALP